MTDLFSPLTVRGMTTTNRIVASPTLLYMAGDDGKFTDVHFVHYGARILGGVGLVMTEIIAVSPEGRISARDLGLWEDDQIEGLQRITGFAHANGAVMGAQLQHAGRKSWLAGNVAPSSTQYDELPLPAALSVDEIAVLVQRYVDTAKRAVAAGFDVIEVHMAHGYLLHEFLSPHTNRRDDEFGGTLENRARFPLAVAIAVRAAIPESMPLFVRMSGEDFQPDGVTLAESTWLATKLVEAGVDLLDVSTGNILHGYDGPVYPGYQASYARDFKNELGVLTAAMGGINTPEVAEYLISSGSSDLVFVGRGLLRNPNWAREAARITGGTLTPAVAVYDRATGPWERGF